MPAPRLAARVKVAMVAENYSGAETISAVARHDPVAAFHMAPFLCPLARLPISPTRTDIP